MHFAIALPRQAIVNSEFSGWYEPPPGTPCARFQIPPTLSANSGAPTGSTHSGCQAPPAAEADQRYAPTSLVAPASCIASSMRSATVVPSETGPVQVEPTRSAPTSGGPSTAMPIGAPLALIPFGLRLFREIPLGLRLFREMPFGLRLNGNTPFASGPFGLRLNGDTPFASGPFGLRLNGDTPFASGPFGLRLSCSVTLSPSMCGPCATQPPTSHKEGMRAIVRDMPSGSDGYHAMWGYRSGSGRTLVR